MVRGWTPGLTPSEIVLVHFFLNLLPFRKLKSQVVGLTSKSSNFQFNCLSLALESNDLGDQLADFKIRFKCMSGFTTENAKFIKPLQQKMSYAKSFDNCDGFGFTNQFFDLP